MINNQDTNWRYDCYHLQSIGDQNLNIIEDAYGFGSGHIRFSKGEGPINAPSKVD